MRGRFRLPKQLQTFSSMAETLWFCILSSGFMMAASFILAKLVLAMDRKWNGKLILLATSLVSIACTNFWRSLLRLPGTDGLGVDADSVISPFFIDMFLIYFGACSIIKSRNSQAVRTFLQKRALIWRQMCSRQVAEAAAAAAERKKKGGVSPKPEDKDTTSTK